MGKKPGPKGPWKYNKHFHPEDFIRQSNQGKTLAQIAKSWKIDRGTINEWAKRDKGFSIAVKKGREDCEAWYMDIGLLAMLGKATMMENGIPVKVSVNLGFFCWMTKNMFKWTDRVESDNKIEHRGEITQTESKNVSLKNIYADPISRKMALDLAEREAMLKRDKKKIDK